MELLGPAARCGLVATTVLGSVLWSSAAEGQIGEDAPRRPGTIAIVAAGENAGLAVFLALPEAEKVARGSIGGVAGMDVMLSDGTICSYQNFGRGGTSTLFVEGEETGVLPPSRIASAPVAAIVSTGPRRPYDLGVDPCDQEFETGRDGVGIVVGHRIPDAVGRDGEPVNAHVMRLMAEGLSPSEAIDRVMGANPSVDAGLIAVSDDGAIAMGNSALVNTRSDYAHARGEDRRAGAVVQTIMNEIHPPQAVAQLVVNVALETMTRSQQPDLTIVIPSGVRVEPGRSNRVEVDADLVATKILVDREEHVMGQRWAVVPYLHSPVFQNGDLIGYTINEPLTELLDGVIKSLSYQDSATISVRREPRTCRYATPYLTVCDVIEGN